MQRVKFVSLSLILGIAFSISMSLFSHSADEEMKTVQGNVICLLPDYEAGTVKPVIATSPCDGLPDHDHVLVTKSAVYTIQGLQDGLQKLEQTPNRTNVKVSGKVAGSDETGWILIVN